MKKFEFRFKKIKMLYTGKDVILFQNSDRIDSEVLEHNAIVILVNGRDVPHIVRYKQRVESKTHSTVSHLVEYDLDKDTSFDGYTETTAYVYERDAKFYTPLASTDTKHNYCKLSISFNDIDRNLNVNAEKPTNKLVVIKADLARDSRGNIIVDERMRVLTQDNAVHIYPYVSTRIKQKDVMTAMYRLITLGFDRPSPSAVIDVYNEIISSQVAKALNALPVTSRNTVPWYNTDPTDF